MRMSFTDIISEHEHFNLYVSFFGKETFILVLGNHYTFIVHFMFSEAFHTSLIGLGNIACSSSVSVETMVSLFTAE